MFIFSSLVNKRIKNIMMEKVIFLKNNLFNIMAIVSTASFTCCNVFLSPLLRQDHKFVPHIFFDPILHLHRIIFSRFSGAIMISDYKCKLNLRDGNIHIHNHLYYLTIIEFLSLKKIYKLFYHIRVFVPKKQ